MIAATDYPHLSLKHCGIILDGVQPVAALVRLQLDLTQAPVDLARRDGSDDASEDGFISRFLADPLGGGTTGLLWGLAW